MHIVSHDPAPTSAEYVATSGGMFKDMVIQNFFLGRYVAAYACQITHFAGIIGGPAPLIG